MKRNEVTVPKVTAMILCGLMIGGIAQIIFNVHKDAQAHRDHIVDTESK
jgi:hypothetical protein